MVAPIARPRSQFSLRYFEPRSNTGARFNSTISYHFVSDENSIRTVGSSPRNNTALATPGQASRGRSISTATQSQPPLSILQALHRPARQFCTAPRTNMASDEEYMNFLDKANQDPSAGYAKSQNKAAAGGNAPRPFRATEQGVEIPEPLRRVTRDTEAFYTSDADEPFELVALRWDEAGKGLPDEEEFATLIDHWAPKEAEVEILDPVDWDRNGRYKDVIDAVTEAGKGNDVRVYRVGRGGVKVEYWVVTAEGKGKDAKLVGVKALAVES